MSRVTVIVGAWASESEIRGASLRQPMAIICCPSQRRLARDGAVVRLERAAMHFMLAIIGRLGNVVTYSEVADLLFADREDGGPECLSNWYSVVKQKLDAAGAVLGIRIERWHGVGFRAHFIEHARLGSIASDERSSLAEAAA